MKKYLIPSLLVITLLITFLSGCMSDSNKGKGTLSQDKSAGLSSFDFEANPGRPQTLSLVAGSENKELEPVLSEFAQKKNISLQINYLGSLDIMNLLRSGDVGYDALWPASSIWLTLGDEKHLLKHSQSISNMPVVFGIRRGKAKALGFDQGEVHIRDISKAIKDGKLSFAMTSASQSNSGASAYLAFLTALAAKGEVLQSTDLKDEKLREEIQALLNGVNRSSGSSNWLIDLFLSSDYDALVNYEALLISANRKLAAQGKETLTLVYPSDAISIADSPLAFVSGDNREEKEKLFLDLQQFLLSQDIQDKIVETGRRDAFGRIPQAQKEIFTAWGIDPDRILSPIPMPRAETVEEALRLYQSSFKKPSLTIYVLDYSGSMSGEGKEQMTAGLEQLLIAKNAEKNYLRGSNNDISTFIAFNRDLIFTETALGNGSDLEHLYARIAVQNTGGGTDMYLALMEALHILDEKKDKLKAYQPAIVLLTDGCSMDFRKDELIRKYQKQNLDIPIFSIMYGDADETQLRELAELSRARVFDGRTDLTAAFKSVKGYN